MLAADSSRDLANAPFGGQQVATAPMQDFTKLFKSEADNLELSISLHFWVCDGVEARVLKKYGKLQ